MRKLLFALAVVVMGGFAFANGTPASAMSAGAVTGLSDLVTANPATENVGRRYGYRHRHYRRGWGWRPHRRCWWRYGRRHCRWVHGRRW
jgi:hypothetical protein